MGMMDRLFGKAAAKPAAPAAPRAAAGAGAASTRGAANSPQSVRKELVRVAVRDMLLHNGIPGQWIRAEPLTTAAPGREAGVHVRLVVQHWDARLMQYAVALQNYAQERIVMLDPDADQWLMGVSWQFQLDDVSHCPALPHPGSWTAPVPQPDSQLHTAPGAMQPVVKDGNADIIEGPTRIQKSGADKRAELERLLSEGDRAFGGDDNDGGFGKTEPMGFEKTQPMTAYQKEQAFDKTQPVQSSPSQFDKTQPVPSSPSQFDKTQPVRRPPSGG